ncbi:MAG: sterol desaturase family protein [Leptospiraceae bacterium]|nr:sterol desaturase family protein [Leptospiraceae bacterium]
MPLPENFGTVKVYFTAYLLMSLRYVLFAGLASFIVWKLLGKKLQHRLIQQQKPEMKKILFEVRYSFLTFLIFALSAVGIYYARINGYTLMYLDISQYGIPYLIFSTVVLILVHDMYFYFGHRLMHTKLLYKKVHLVHHNSTNPSPWASFSFHPYEAVIEAGIIPIMVFVLPLHPIAILSFILFMTGMNVLGHLAYELFPSGFTTHPFFKWLNTSTHHNMHHKHFNCNYGLYFNWWDRIFNTNHEKYHERFEEVANRPKVEEEKLKLNRIASEPI